MLGADRLGRFLEDEELVLEAGVGVVPQRPAAVYHTPQQGTRAHRFGGRGKLPEEEQPPVLERQRPTGIGQDAGRCIRVTGVPARVLDVVVELVLAIPAEHDVAEAEAAVERRQEFFARDVLAAQDAVDVEDAHLDVLYAAFLDQCAGVLRRAHLPRFHVDLLVGRLLLSSARL